LSFWSIKNTAQKDIEEAKTKIKDELKDSLANEIKDSKAFYDNIINDILGRFDDKLVTQSDVEKLSDVIDKLQQDVKAIYELESTNEKLDKKASKSEIIKNNNYGTKRAKNK
jgi:hypothetical protein